MSYSPSSQSSISMSPSTSYYSTDGSDIVRNQANPGIPWNQILFENIEPVFSESYADVEHATSSIMETMPNACISMATTVDLTGDSTDLNGETNYGSHFIQLQNVQNIGASSFTQGLNQHFPQSTSSLGITRSTRNAPGVMLKPKRFRTALTTDQIKELEREYAIRRYIDISKRKELMQRLNLTERTIKVWFQNRRMKEKKDYANGFQEHAVSSTGSAFEVASYRQLHIQYPMKQNNVDYPGVPNESWGGIQTEVPVVNASSLIIPVENSNTVYSSNAASGEDLSWILDEFI